MNIPTWREWLYSAKALIATLLALYIALAIPLDNPYWAMASVYVVSHPLSGATRSKAIYRALGTLLGAAASVAMVPPLVHQPVLLSLVMALWIGVLLYLSLLDRTPRSYVFMLAAYSVPLISLGQVNHPTAIFDVALARSEEILLGITCAALVNGLLFPSRLAPLFGARMDALLGDARRWISRSLSLEHLGEADRRALHKMFADVMPLDGMILHLSHDSASHLPTRQAREFRARMALLLPQMTALAEPLRRLRRELGELPAELAEMLARLDAWLQGEADEAGAAALREHSLELETWLCDAQPAQAPLIGGAMHQLRQLIALWQDCLALRRHFGEPTPALAYKAHLAIGAAQHFDYGLLAFAAASVGLSVFVACLAWIALGWDYGFTGVFLVAVSGCFFASQDNPAPAIFSFLLWTLVSTVAAGIYLFGVLPTLPNFEALLAVLALPLLLLGTLSGRPQFTAIVMLVAVQTISNITLRDSYQADFQQFADISLSSILGLVFALVWARISRPFGVEWIAHRLARSAWHDLAELTEGSRARDHARIAARLIDRTGQLLPRLAQARDPRLSGADPTRDLRIGLRLLELQQSPLPAAPRRLLEAPLGALRDYFQACARARQALPPPAELGQRLDAARDALQALPGSAARKAAQALAGLGLALFPDAPQALPAGVSP